MNASKSGALLIGVLIFFALFKIEGWGADWQPYHKDESSTIYYDAANIRQISKGTLRVWEKTIYRPKGVEDMIKALSERYRELAYCISLFEINCLERKYKELHETVYKDDRSVLDLLNYEAFGKADWRYVIPDSIEEALLDAVCQEWGLSKGGTEFRK
jgi:hypothetical protein